MNDVGNQIADFQTGKDAHVRKSILFVALIVVASSWLVGKVDAANPRQITVVSGAFRGVSSPGHYVVFGHSSWELAPGGFGAVQSATFIRFYTISAGQLTATIGTETKVFAAGQGFMVPAGIQSQVRNNGHMAATFMLTSVWLPGLNRPGGLVVVPGTASTSNPPRMTSGITGGARPAALPGTIDVLQQIIDYEPGFRTPNHVMNHPHVITILRGEVTFGYLDGTVERYKAGETAVMTPGRPGYMANETGDMATWQITWLATPGTPLTSAISAPAAAVTRALAPPGTGDAGLADRKGIVASPLAQAFLLTLVLSLLVVLHRARARS